MNETCELPPARFVAAIDVSAHFDDSVNGCNTHLCFSLYSRLGIHVGILQTTASRAQSAEIRKCVM